MTYEEKFINTLSKLNIQILTSYTNSNTKIEVIGTCGHTIDRTPDKILRTINSSGVLKCGKCARKRTKTDILDSQEEIKKEIESYSARLVSEYTSANIPIKIIGQCGHELTRTINSIRRSILETKKLVCKKCAYTASGLERRKSVIEISKLCAQYGGKLDETSYTTEGNKVIVTGSCGHTFERRVPDLRNTIKKMKSVLCPTCNGKSRSVGEQELSDYVKSLGLKVIDNYRPKGKRGYELDVYVPELKIGFDYHGIFWHSETILKKKNRVPSNYHLDKSVFFDSLGITALQIFETEWNTKKDIIKSIVSSKLHANSIKIFARKCEKVTLTQTEAKKFFTETHRQGHVNGFLYVGLFYENTIVAAMSFGKSRFSTKYDTELLRFSTVPFTSIAGGFSRLLKFAEASEDIGTLTTYADIRYSGLSIGGTVYSKNGFTEVNKSKPNYFYFKGSGLKLESRNKFQKHMLSAKFENFSSDNTEYENMVANGYGRIWDCGNLVFVKECSTKNS